MSRAEVELIRALGEMTKVAVQAKYDAGIAKAYAAGHAAGQAEMRERAALAIGMEDREGRDWLKDSLWGKLTREAQARVRALPTTAGGGHDT